MDNYDLPDLLKQLQELRAAKTKKTIECSFCGLTFHPTEIHKGPYCTWTCELMSMEAKGFKVVPEMYESLKSSDDQAVATEAFIRAREKVESEEKNKKEASVKNILGSYKTT
jgi:uncharacterized protein (DUF2225 family)